MPSNKDAGKAFEFALISEAHRILSSNFQTSLFSDATYLSAESSFLLYPENVQSRYIGAARSAISHIQSLEPRLQEAASENDILELRLMPDSAGQKGDVRDILFVRSSQNWEIGISAKNNHKAVKHSRLSQTKDFGSDWLGFPASKEYFQEIFEIFEKLKHYKRIKLAWSAVSNKPNEIYAPVLKAFREELLKLNETHPNVPQNLASYLLGKQDFYKVIKKSKRVEILGFNIHGNLNKNSKNRSLNQMQRLKLPTEIIRFDFKPGKLNTLILVCDEGWQISFRIHSAETLVVPSLKFDTNLIGHPESLYSHHLTY
ncbi:HaeIII family restriction endonuclease [Fluviicola sp.]|uniref:HaeIII family restriction endonuclease n=1 Tax=Fluviicola sp. TaxID=1917219 RepID=UPI003D267699